MFLGYQDGKIKFYCNDIPEPRSFYPDVEWVETTDEYVIVDDEYVLKDSDKAKEKAERDVRELRDSLITSIDWRIQRYQEQAEMDYPTTDDVLTYKGMLFYKQYLRNIPESIGFPDVEVLTFEKWLDKATAKEYAGIKELDNE